LLSPIALYPDSLLAAMLPAATRPSEIAAAASLTSVNTAPAQIDQQPWDDSVKVLAHYPAVTTWMAQNQEWTNELGTAVLDEQPAVLDSIQRLRANARASGLLVDTPQQRVVVASNYISIVPAQPGVIYVPSYDPQYLYAPGRREIREPLQFGAAFTLGSIGALFGLDWSAHSLWIDHNRSVQSSRDNRRFFATAPTRQEWRPAVEPSRRERSRQRTVEQFQVPQPTRYSERVGRWQPPTQTPGLVPTGRVYTPPATVVPPGRGREKRDEDRRVRGQPQTPPPNERDVHEEEANPRDRDHRDRDDGR
jgi:hypothetical protein